jgi:hypothetical protein
MKITTEAVQLHGGYGYCQDYWVERLMRDAKVTQIWEGANQVRRQFVGRSFLARYRPGVSTAPGEVQRPYLRCSPFPGKTMECG